MIKEERKFVVENQKIIIERDIKGEWLLDVGGGGEGVIGLCYGDRVTAIDPNKQELVEAPEGPLKIVMDAKELGFLDNTFDAATAFFTMMYIPMTDLERVFSEIYRVLKEGGEFYLWDSVIPKYDDSEKDIYVIMLEIALPGVQVKTGYGTLRKNREQDMNYFIALGKKVGFKVLKTFPEEHLFKVVFKK
jgi:ubiquinone/menaquinone biosynthesis C-methylase UbiE